MIRTEPVATIVRFYETQTDDPYADCCATCTILWESTTVVWIKALNGKITRKHIFELVHWLISQGATTVKATRAGGKRLPFSKDVGDYQEILIADFVNRAQK